MSSHGIRIGRFLLRFPNLTKLMYTREKYSLAQQSLVTLPKSCPNSDGGNSNDFGLAEQSGLYPPRNPLSREFILMAVNVAFVFTNQYDDANCTGTAPKSVLPISGNFLPYQVGNSSLYDRWATKTAPVFLGIFSNATIYSGDPFDYMQFFCTSPKNPAPGSRVPTSAGEHGPKVTLSLLAGVAFMVNAGFLFML